jgi:hypothetical protein
MAAEASFTLRAIDATKAAFASVQNSLQRLKGQSEAAGSFMKKAFDGKQIGAALATALGINLQDMSEKIARFVTGQSEETQKLQDELMNLGDEAINSAMALARARNTDEQNLKALIIAQERLNVLVAKPATDLQGVVNAKKNEISLNGVNLEILRLTEKIEKDKLTVSAEMLAANERLAKSNAGLYGDQLDKVSQLRDLEQLRAKLMGAAEEGDKLRTSIAADTEEQEIKRKLKLADVNEKLAVLYREQNRLSMEAGEIIAMGFEDAILSGEKFSEVLKQIARDLVRLVFQNVITAPLAKGIGGAISTAFGMRAMGGPVSSGSPYIVGERGPELFVPRASGSIVSNSNMNQGGGSAGPSINVNYNIAAGVTRNELGPILEQERRRLKAEIPDMVRRGGAYRSAFA